MTAIALEVALLRLPLVKAIVMLVATVCDRLVKLTRPATAVRLVAPCKLPLPALRAARTTVLLSLLRRLPNWSSILITGCCAKAIPAVAVEEGCVCMVKRLATAGLTAMGVEVAPVKPPPAKLIVIVSARLYERLVKLATPLSAVAVSVPCKLPLPRPRLTVTTVLLSELIKFPNPSSIRTTGCCANGTPAVALAEGWV